jgi:curli biogenesis system outer membrane secretion channel CsgG
MTVKIRSVLAATFVGAALTACGSSQPVLEKDVVNTTAPPKAATRDITLTTKVAEYSGEKMVVGVLPFGLSQRVAMLYPKLRDAAIGLGVHNMVENTLADTNRFRFVETNQEVLKDILERQWSSNAGFTAGAAIEYGGVLGATKVIYGEVYDYAEGGEKVGSGGAQKGFITRVGVQVTCTDVMTGERIAVGTGTGIGSDYGTAAEGAIRQAVERLVGRM